MRIWAIALNTFREAVRDKILYTLLGFALVMIASAALVADLALGEYQKIIRDLGLTSISVFGVAIAIFVGIGLVYKEIERKTIYTIASKPVPRWQFLVGKYVGLAAVLAVETGIMSLGLFALFWLSDSFGGVSVLSAIWLTYVELLVITAIAILFSCFSTPTLSAFFAVGLTAVGRITADLKEIGQSAEGELFRWFSGFVYRVLPDLQTFNVRREAAYGLPVDWEYVAYATGYGATWVAVLLAGAILIFQRRDFR